MASIAKRSNGAWRARYRDSEGKEHSRHFARKVDGQRWLNTVTASIVTGSYVDPRAGTVTFRQFFTDWSQRQIWTQGTTRAVNLSVKSATFADVELRVIRRSHVESWIKGMDESGLAALTIHSRMMNVRTILRAAVRDKLIATDPSEGVTLPRRRRAAHAMEIPAAEAVGALYEAAEPWFRPFIGLTAFAGLRLGEAAAIQVGDVDFLRRTLNVSRQVQREAGHDLEIRAPKYGSERIVALPDELLLILSRHVSEVGVYGEDQWFFAGEDGLPARPRRISYAWDKTVAAAGVGKMNAHSLRHFYASGLIAAGCDVVTVQRSLGHASPAVTLNTYSHLWPDAADRTRAAAGALLAGALRFPADSLRTEATQQASD